MKRFRYLGVLVVCVGLSACGNDGLDDLRDFIKTAGADRKPQVEPIPELKPHEPFIYAAESLPDPFAPANLRPLSAQTNGPRPDMNRRKEALEAYPLDSLKMVGTIVRGNKRWAIIQAPDGTVQQAQVGNHVGQNFGAVTKITEDKIDLIELIPGAAGDWVERPASLVLAE